MSQPSIHIRYWSICFVEQIWTTTAQRGLVLLPWIGLQQFGYNCSTMCRPHQAVFKLDICLWRSSCYSNLVRVQKSPKAAIGRVQSTHISGRWMLGLCSRYIQLPYITQIISRSTSLCQDTPTSGLIMVQQFHGRCAADHCGKASGHHCNGLLCTTCAPRITEWMEKYFTLTKYKLLQSYFLSCHVEYLLEQLLQFWLLCCNTITQQWKEP